MDYDSPTPNSFEKCSKMFFLSLFTAYASLTILCETWAIKRQQMAKMNNRVPKERLNHVFLKLYLYDPTSKFQE